jgi:hypothetical protein
MQTSVAAKSFGKQPLGRIRRGIKIDLRKIYVLRLGSE